MYKHMYRTHKTSFPLVHLDLIDLINLIESSDLSICYAFDGTLSN